MLPWICSGKRRADGAFDAAGVGRGEHLLGRHVRDVLDAVGLVERRLPVTVAMQTDRQVGSRPAVAQLREAPLVQRGRAILQAADVIAPGCDRVRLIEAHCLADGRPEPLDVRLSQNRARPAFIRVGHDRPVAEAVGQLQ